MNPLRAVLRRPLPPRVGIVQAELDRFDRSRYLEIGCKDGVLFMHVRASRKVGVDPVPSLPPLKRLMHPNTILRGEVVAATSDEWFAGPGANEEFDVVFVDGDHHYRQCLRDIESSLAQLGPGGVVMAHDCNPASASAASPDPADAAGEPWCGDVWKAIAHLRASRGDLEVHTLDTDFGVGVVRRRDRNAQPPLELDVAELEGMTYADLAARREELLGLRPYG